MADDAHPDLIIVTGMSGAGRTTALRALEDFGFDAVDNLPLSFLRRLAVYEAASDGDIKPLAVGIDLRSRDLDAHVMNRELAFLRGETPYEIRILFVDSDDDTLIGRFKETRRPHPLAPDRPVVDGIRLERRRIAPFRDIADLVIDSSALTIWQFREKMRAVFAGREGGGMSVSVLSFSYRSGVPRDADLVFDVRFLRNPHYVAGLKDQTGQDAAVGAYIEDDPDFSAFLAQLTALLDLTLPRYAQEGKSHLSIAVGCTGGKHRSVYLAEKLAAHVAEKKQYAARVIHRELGVASKT